MYWGSCLFYITISYGLKCIDTEYGIIFRFYKTRDKTVKRFNPVLSETKVFKKRATAR